MEGDGGGVGVVECEGGAPVAVAGLADGAGVDEVAGCGRQTEGPNACLGILAEEGLKGGAEFVPVVLFLREATLDVGVAEEGDGGGHLLEGSPGVAHVENVLVFVEGGAVGAGDALLGGVCGTLGESFEPFEVGGGELGAGPEGCGAGDGVEGVCGGEAAADAVVISADDEVLEGTDALDDLVGAASVADDVAEVPKLS